MLKKYNGLSLTVLSLSCCLATTGCAATPTATSAKYDFETNTTGSFSKLQGKGSEGSKLEVTGEKVYEGKQSLKLAYESAGGFIEFLPSNSQKLNFTGDALHLAVWVYGAGKRDFSQGVIRLQDDNNEAFQFVVPGLADAIAGEGWREVRATIDLNKSNAHWGANSDGKLDRPFRWFGFAATRSSETAASGVFYLDDLRLSDQPIPAAVAPAVATTPEKTAKATLMVAPITKPVAGSPSEFGRWVFTPQQPVAFRVQVGLPDAKQAHQLSWKVRDAFDVVVAQGNENLAAGTAEKALELRVPNAPKGVFYLTASLRNAREEVITETESRAAVFLPRDKPSSLSPFVWGVAAHLGRENGRHADDEIVISRMIGFSSMRTDLLWSDIQPQADVWKWEKFDRIYGALKREGIAPLTLFAYGTKWATTGDANHKDWHQWNNTPPRTEAFAAYAREAVKRYGAQSRFWEIWNEPDIDFWLGSVEEYTKLFNKTAAAIKAEQPDALVMNGGFTATNRRPEFIPAFLKSGGTRPDILAFHTHMQFENLLRAEADIKRKLQNAGWTGEKLPPLWLNESGYSSFRNSPEREQAMQLVKKMAYASATGLQAYYWYDLRDDGIDDNEIEHNFGLVKKDFRPKAALVAASTLIENLGGRRFDKRLGLRPNEYALTYRGAGKTILTSWRQAQSGNGADLPVLVKAKGSAAALKSLQTSDIFGNTKPLQAQDGLFLLSLSDVPQYIVANDEKLEFELAGHDGQLLEYASRNILTPNEALKLPVKVFNPFARALTGQLTVAGAKTVAVNVPANATATYEVVVPRQSKAGTRENLKIQFQSPLLPGALQTSSEILTSYVVPDAPQALEISPARSGIVSLFEATPMQALHFKDAADLSATAKLQKTANGVQVSVVVNDQTHFVSEAAGTWWKGDSLQWAIGLPSGEMWEWTAALLPTGPQMVLTLAPDGKVGAASPISIKREGAQTVYTWTLPRALPNGKPLPERFGFNFLINDSDGSDRKGWLELTPGIGREKNASAFAPMFVPKH